MNAFSYNTDNFGSPAGPISFQGDGATPQDALNALNGKIAFAGKNPVVLYLETVTGAGKFYCIALCCFPETATGRAAIIGGNTTI